MQTYLGREENGEMKKVLFGCRQRRSQNTIKKILVFLSTLIQDVTSCCRKIKCFSGRKNLWYMRGQELSPLLFDLH